MSSPTPNVVLEVLVLPSNDDGDYKQYRDSGISSLNPIVQVHVNGFIGLTVRDAEVVTDVSPQIFHCFCLFRLNWSFPSIDIFTNFTLYLFSPTKSLCTRKISIRVS